LLPLRQRFPEVLVSRADFKDFLAANGVDFNTIKESSDQLNEWSARFIAQRWEAWSAVNDLQRDAALTAEWIDLSPSRDSRGDNILQFSARHALFVQSHQNLERLLARLPALIPLKSEPSPALEHEVTQISQELNLHFLGTRTTSLSPAVQPPLVSPRELEKLGLEFPLTSYAQLIGRTETSVALRGVGVRAKDGERPYISHMYDESFEIEPEYAQAQGFVLPALTSSKSFYGFFEIWDPPALEELVRFNRIHLPSDIERFDDLKMHELRNGGKPLFTPAEYHRALTPLRQRLHLYVLTVPDATLFLRAALKRYILHHAELGDHGDFKLIMMSLARETGAQRFINGEFLKDLGWGEGFTLRVPISVPGGKLKALP
jgi:hypothetical protein